MAMESASDKDKSPEQNQNKLIKGFRLILSNKLAAFGLLIIVVQVIMAIFTPVITSYSPNEQHLNQADLGVFSSSDFLLGTDNYGRDIFSRLVHGARISLIVGVTSVSIGVIGGVTLGLLAGYYKKLDAVIMRLVDLLFAFPGILLAMLVIAILGTSLVNVVIAISIWSIPGCARIVRGSALTVKEQEYILSMKSLGASDLRILIKHILPNCMAPIIVFATMRMATTLLSTSALSFLGLGAQPPTPEWGAMIADAQDFIWDSPHMSIIPGIAIMLTVFAFNVVGDGLRDALDPNIQTDA